MSQNLQAVLMVLALFMTDSVEAEAEAQQVLGAPSAPKPAKAGSSAVDLAMCAIDHFRASAGAEGGALGFRAHAVDYDRPFISATGFRSFLDPGRQPLPGETMDAFARRLIDDHARSLETLFHIAA